MECYWWPTNARNISNHHTDYLTSSDIILHRRIQRSIVDLIVVALSQDELSMYVKIRSQSEIVGIKVDTHMGSSAVVSSRCQ